MDNKTTSITEGQNIKQNATKNILVAFLLNLFFVILEIIGGIVTNSVAILSDSIHDFGDCISIGFAYILEKKSNNKPNDKYTYGYKRYSILSAMLTSLILLVGGIIVIYSSIRRLISPEVTNGIGMLIIALLGVLINTFAFLRTRKGTNINEKSINLHMLEDVLGWAVVLIGSIFIAIFEWSFIDPILSILVTIYIFYNVIKNILNILSIILEKTPKNFDMSAYKTEMLEIEGVEDVHHIHVWTLDGDNLLATIHIVVADEMQNQEINEIKHEIIDHSKEFKIHHITIQVDCSSDKCADEECKVSTLATNSSCGHHHHHH